MSLSRRFLNLVRSNLNALLDSVSGEDPRLEDLSDDELEAELERRRERRRREEEERRRAAAVDRAAAAERVARERAERERADDKHAGPERSDGERTGRRSTQGRGASGSTSGRATSGSSGSSGTRNAPPRPSSPPAGDRLARLYATLETPVGADLATVKQNFRRLMRKHHPDLYAGDPERQRTATERSKQITQAFTELERHLQSR